MHDACRLLDLHLAIGDLHYGLISPLMPFFPRLQESSFEEVILFSREKGFIDADPDIAIGLPHADRAISLNMSLASCAYLVLKYRRSSKEEKHRLCLLLRAF